MMNSIPSASIFNHLYSILLSDEKTSSTPLPLCDKFTLVYIINLRLLLVLMTSSFSLHIAWHNIMTDIWILPQFLRPIYNYINEWIVWLIFHPFWFDFNWSKLNCNKSRNITIWYHGIHLAFICLLTSTYQLKQLKCTVICFSRVQYCV